MKYKKRYVLISARPIFGDDRRPVTECDRLKLGVCMIPVRHTEITGRGRETPVYNLVWERIDKQAKGRRTK